MILAKIIKRPSLLRPFEFDMKLYTTVFQAILFGYHHKIFVPKNEKFQMSKKEIISYLCVCVWTYSETEMSLLRNCLEAQ